MTQTDFTEQISSVFEPLIEPITSTLSTALNRKVEVRISEIQPTDATLLAKNYPGDVVIAQVKFSEGFAEGIDFLLTTKSVARLADLMLMGEGDAEFSPAEHLDGISELLNQVGGVLCTYLTDLRGSPVKLEPVNAAVEKVKKLTGKWESYFQADLTILLEGFGDELISLQIPPETVADLEATSMGPNVSIEDRPPPAVRDDDEADEEAGTGQEPEVRSAAFEDFGPDASGGSAPAQSIETLMDLELPVIIELGRTNMFIRDILELSPGSIVELNKLSGEPVDLYINDKRFARGEVVVIDENFGIRITDLVKVEDRIRTLK